MTIEVATERFVAIAFLVSGLSHLLAPGAWSAFFVRLRAAGVAGGIANALIHGPTGFLILAFHPVWRGPGIVITLIGVGLTCKALLYGVRPGLFQRVAHDVDQPWRFRVAGVVAIAIGVFSGWLSLR